MLSDEKSTETTRAAVPEKLYQAISLGNTVHQALKNVHDNGDSTAALYDIMVVLEMQSRILEAMLEPDEENIPSA